ncbi:unnamed protein product [Protopolystoma xenopodis]|uniref:Uncharacterized protein n=1 Tax=Protopolystoma xenopodis TaxID=117903 RepID=A0A448X575_9PLAT|nr:unnamed protein product [Protopolystoma xenopodis]
MSEDTLIKFIRSAGDMFHHLQSLLLNESDIFQLPHVFDSLSQFKQRLILCKGQLESESSSLMQCLDKTFNKITDLLANRDYDVEPENLVIDQLSYIFSTLNGLTDSLYTNETILHDTFAKIAEIHLEQSSESNATHADFCSQTVDSGISRINYDANDTATFELLETACNDFEREIRSYKMQLNETKRQFCRAQERENAIKGQVLLNLHVAF